MMDNSQIRTLHRAANRRSRRRHPFAPPLCSTTFGGSTIPPIFGGGGGGGNVIVMDVNTTGGTAIACWGGNECFPILDVFGYNASGELFYGTRTATGGDTLLVWETFGPDIAPPFYVAGSQWTSTDLTAIGGITHTDTDINDCMSIANSGRFQVGAGLTETHVASYLYRVNTGQNPGVEPLCPQDLPGGTILDTAVSFTFNFRPF